MLSSRIAALAACSLSCAHTEPGEPSLAGHVGDLRFDRVSINGPHVSLGRSSDGNWSGNFWCGPRIITGEIQVREDAVQVAARVWPVVYTPHHLAIREGTADVVFRRQDGGPVPRELLLPLWLALRSGGVCSQMHLPGPLPVRRCLAVEGIGLVEVLVVPERPEQSDLPAPGCSPRIGEAPPPVDLTSGGPAR